jgi:dsRNA-specific ribonuclease
MTLFVLTGLFLTALAAWVVWRRWVLRRRQTTLTRLLDLADAVEALIAAIYIDGGARGVVGLVEPDAVEALLNRSQARMTALQALVTRVPADIGAVAQASLESHLPIREAKRDVLQHRLWIQQNSASARQDQLDIACAALERARQKLSRQLESLENAGAELAIATQAATEAAKREPPALRRDPRT